MGRGAAPAVARAARPEMHAHAHRGHSAARARRGRCEALTGQAWWYTREAAEARGGSCGGVYSDDCLSFGFMEWTNPSCRK